MNTMAHTSSPSRRPLSDASTRYEVSSVMLRDKYDRTQILLEWIGRRRRVLEIGCSTGYISKLLVERECDVTGLEVDPEAAERARKYCGNVIVTDLNHAEWLRNLSGEAFDVVLFADVLEHLVDPLRVLRESARVLNPNAAVVISLPNIVHWVARASIATGQFNYVSTGTFDHTHLRFFTVKTARELIRSAGYSITRFHPAIGGRLSGHTRALWQALARFAPGLFAYQLLFEAKLMPNSY
jgi:methionine biosynthesis protein MetW